MHNTPRQPRFGLHKLSLGETTLTRSVMLEPAGVEMSSSLCTTGRGIDGGQSAGQTSRRLPNKNTRASTEGGAMNVPDTHSQHVSPPVRTDMTDLKDAQTLSSRSSTPSALSRSPRTGTHREETPNFSTPLPSINLAGLQLTPLVISLPERCETPKNKSPQGLKILPIAAAMKARSELCLNHSPVRMLTHFPSRAQI